MLFNNPFAQAGWYNPLNLFNVSNGGSGGREPTLPPNFGALPSSWETSSNTVFRFTQLDPDIFNCQIVDERSLVCLKVETRGTITHIRKPDGELFGAIDWSEHPLVVIPGVVERQLSANFLRLSPERRYYFQTCTLFRADKRYTDAPSN